MSEKEDSLLFETFVFLLAYLLIFACIVAPRGLIGLMYIFYQFALAMAIGLAVSIPCLLTWNPMVSRFGYEKACVIASIILTLIAATIMTVTILMLI